MKRLLQLVIPAYMVSAGYRYHNTPTGDAVGNTGSILLIGVVWIAIAAYQWGQEDAD